MNKQEFSAIMLIVKKLGWNDMPATVALEAIQRMINNEIAVLLDCCGTQESEEETLQIIASWEDEQIWLSLFGNDYQTRNDESLEHWALTYRPQIEAWMRLGHSFEEACNEWDIPSKEWEWEQYQSYLAEMQEAYDETIYSLKYSFN
jgi:hypothetical protein